MYSTGSQVKYHYYLIAYILISIYYLSFYKYGVNLWDEGILPNGALRILNGEMVYRDFYGYPYGEYLVVVLVFKIFGISLNIVRIFTALYSAMMPILVFSIANRVMDRKYSLLAGALMLSAPGMYYSRFLTFFLLLCLFSIIRYLEDREKRYNLLFFIFCTILALSFKTEIAAIAVIVFMFMKIIIAVIEEPQVVYRRPMLKKAWICWIVPVIAVIIAAGIVCSRLDNNTRISFIISYIFHQVFKIHKVWSNPLPDITDAKFYASFNVLLDNMLYYLPVISYFSIIAFSILSLWKRRGLSRCLLYYQLLVVAIGGLLAYGLVIWRAGFDNLLRITPPFYILGAFILYRLEGKIGKIRSLVSSTPSPLLSRLKRVLITLSCMSMIILYIFHLNIDHGFYAGSISAVKTNYVQLKMDRLDIYCTPYDDFVIRGVTDYIKRHTRNTDYIFSIPLNPLWYFLTLRQNPTFYEWILPGAFRNHEEEYAVIKILEDKRPVLIIYADIAIDNKEERRFSYYAPNIYNYMLKNYTIKSIIGIYQIYMRNDYINA